VDRRRGDPQRRGSGVQAGDYSGQGMRYRLEQGWKGEDFVIQQLAKHGVNIQPAKDYNTDAKLKIDGYWDGKPIQIKLRKSQRGDSNDIAYEVCRNHDREIPLAQQLQDIHQQGRDYRGQVAYYFVMNREETEIYQIDARHLKILVQQAIKEIGTMAAYQGRLHRAYQSRQGVDLRPTRDPDPNSFTPFKVMAFIPVESLPVKRYPIQKVA
jgi:hypothetical protein